MRNHCHIVIGTVFFALALNGCGGAGVAPTGTGGRGGNAGKGGSGGKAGTGGAGGAVGNTDGAADVAADGGLDLANDGADAALDNSSDGPLGMSSDALSEAGADGGADTAAAAFSIGGTVTGLAGSGLTLSDGTTQTSVNANGAFTFATKRAAGTSATVTVTQQPTMPSQTCTVTNGAISNVTQDVTDVAVTCVTSRFTIGGTLSGLSGGGLVLQNNGGNDLALSANGAFVFTTSVASGATFTVTVKTQPTSPIQTCQVSGGSGTVGGANIASVAINCGVDTFTVAGTISGLVGTGLVLQNNGGDDLSVTGNGSFAFATPIRSDDSFAVTVKTQPSAPVQTCTVTQGTGTAAAGNVNSVTVTCATNTYPIGGSVSGLLGSGLSLQNNLANTLSISANGSFTFTTPVASGAPYAVTVQAQPSSPSQTCTVTGGTGSVAAAAVTGVAVACATNSYTVGGTVVGLSGTGLTLKNSGGDDLIVTANGAFSFATPVISGGAFAVTVAAQPTGPSQTCVVSGGSGTVGGTNVTSATINCATDQHTVSGNVSNLLGAGLTLSLNGGAALPVSSSGGFAFPDTLPSGGTYAVTVASQPTTPWQTCTVTGGTGTIAAADISGVSVACVTNSYAIGGAVTGLTGSGLKLSNSGGTDLPVSANGTFTFPGSTASGQAYNVVVSAQPTTPWQTCVVSNATGTVAGAAITNVAVACTTNKSAVGGSVAGLEGTVVLQNGSDSLTLTTNGAFAFATTVTSGATYAVTVKTQPATPDQVCSVANGAGTVAGAPITNVTVTCVTNKFKVGGALIGLTGSGLVLQDNAGDDLTITAGAATFTFATSVDSGATYAVTVKTQPSSPTQTCVVLGGTGTIGASDVNSVTVNCSTNRYVIGGTVTSLHGAGLVLQNNGGGDLALSGTGSFAFTAPLSSGQTYAVTVLTQPTNPWQTCTVTGGSGTVTNANVSVQVNCVANPYPISVAVTNLSGSGFVLQDNAADNLAISSNGTSTFATPVASGLTYAVTVLSQPTSPWQTCTVTGPAGTVGGAGVTLPVNCLTNTYTVGGTVSGLTGSGLVLSNNGGNDLPVSANGTFTFSTPIASGAAYAVTVKTAPSSPAQSCLLTNATGTVGAAKVTNVGVSCANVATCAAVDENQTLSLSCPAGHTILSIAFASYGTPNGSCGAFTQGSCHAGNSASIVSAACVGQQSCTVPATNGTFGDPCGGTFKRLWVQASCS